MPDQPRFEAWRPSDRAARFHGVKLLILGESHYEEPDEDVFDDNTDDPLFTQKIARKWGVEPIGRQRFFAHLFEMMTGLPWTPEASHSQLWNHVWFCNYVQALVSDGDGKKPTKKQFADAGPAFRTTLETIRPEAVLVMGARLWTNMIDEDARRPTVSTALGLTCAYRLNDGSEVLAAHTWHPSAPGIRTLDWHPKIMAFLSDVKAATNRETSGS